MAPLLGTSGIVLIVAGLHLLWQARRGFFYWLERYLRIFKSRLEQFPNKRTSTQPEPPGPGARREGIRAQDLETLRIAVGVLLAFLLGPALLALGLTL